MIICSIQRTPTGRNPMIIKKIKYKAIVAFSILLASEALWAASSNYTRNNIEYGFTGFTGDFDINTPEYLVTGKKMIDHLASHEIDWLRMGTNISIKKYNSPTDIEFNTKDWEQSVKLYEYAKSKGMKIFFTTYPAYELTPKGLSERDFLTSVRNQYEHLARKFPKADVWQIYNEANTHHKDNYLSVCNHPDFACINNKPTSLPSQYMESLKKTITAARESIKKINPTARITTNAENSEEYAKKYMRELKGTLDIFSFDIYPDEYDHANNFRNLKENLAQLKSEFGEKFWVVETGKPSSAGNCATESTANTEAQKKFLLNLIPAFAEQAVSHVMLYEFRDRDVQWYPECEKRFGISDRKNSEKPAFSPVLKLMQLYKYMPTQGNTVASSQGVYRIYLAYQESFGRAPFKWEVYGDSNDGWLTKVINQNLSRERIREINEDWLMSESGLREKQDVIIRSYQAVFGRTPKPHELTNWKKSAFRGYSSLLKSHENWLASQEAENERIDLITRSYQSVFHRPPTAIELNSWMSTPAKPFEALIENHRNWIDYNQN